ncbi:hypothetical protein T261_1743 [Streptomyces lydicus]|nr:hypothetical protein T261_1743 [Streptomyces lydicus]
MHGIHGNPLRRRHCAPCLAQLLMYGNRTTTGADQLHGQ